MGIFNIKVREITLDVDKYTKTFVAAMERELRLGAREWLKAVVPSIPVYSGASVGAFVPISRFLRQAVPDTTPTPNALKRKWGTDQVHGADMGAALSSFAFNRDGQKFTFTFDSKVPQYLTNEVSVGLGMPPLLHPTPYRSLELGNAAFKEYLSLYLKKKIPKVRDFVVFSDYLGG